MSECPTCGNEYSIMGNHYCYYPDHKPEDWDECPGCGERYDRLGQHWNASNCERPQLTERQLDIATGLLMGDATLLRGDKNAALQIGVITEEYLHHLNDLFGIHGTSVTLSQSAADSARLCRESGFSPGAKAENYSDLYRWHTRNHPQLNQFRDWYTPEGKRFPEDLSLSPTVLKHWYCCDGSMDTNYGSHRFVITMSNEQDRRELIAGMFTNVGLPNPAFEESTRVDGSTNCFLRFNTTESEEVFGYMGKAVPGFEYKWP